MRLESLARVLQRIHEIQEKFGIKFLQQSQENFKETLKKTSGFQNDISSNYFEIIKKASQEYKVDENLIRAIILAESNFNKDAVSPKGAQGLMQLMPETAKYLGVQNAFDPYQNIFGGTKYIASLIEKYQGNLRLALAAYNAGEGIVDKLKDIPPYPETQNFVEKVLNYFKEFSKL